MSSEALFLTVRKLCETNCFTTVETHQKSNQESLRGHIIAVGIPGASAISPVGTFLPGGPIHDNPALAASTQPGQVLDPARILVGSRSNFGAPAANPDQLEGSFLSIDPRGTDTLVIPLDFAAAEGQASIFGGRVQLYSAQSPAFLNGINTPKAVTAGFTGVSNPLGFSINNALGRLWPADAPTGLYRIGTSTILDPNGTPLANAPNTMAGGVFAGNLTPRIPTQVLAGGLNMGAVGTAFLGRSPDGSTKVVFSVVVADGSIVQAHTLKAVDGLAPVATVAPLLGRRWDNDDENRESTSPRLGVIPNYTPTRILYVSEPFEGTIAAIDLADDGVIFRVAAVRRFRSEALHHPVDLPQSRTKRVIPTGPAIPLWKKGPTSTWQTWRQYDRPNVPGRHGGRGAPCGARGRRVIGNGSPQRHRYGRFRHASSLPKPARTPSNLTPRNLPLSNLPATLTAAER